MQYGQLRSDSSEFAIFQKLIERRIGIKFPETKKSLLDSRFSNHIKKLGLNSFKEYYELVMSDHDEYQYFISKITTHTTSFFRESHQFDFLVGKGIEILNRKFAGEQLKVLSLASSTGEEMFTLGMILQGLKEQGIISGYSIHGADISKHSLLSAKEGVFKIDHLKSIPKSYLKYFDIVGNEIRAKRVLTQNMRYFLLNACKRDQHFPDSYHIIFCRNMLIYLPIPMQQNVLDNIDSIIKTGGLLFIGHSESLRNVANDFYRIEPTIFQGK